MKNVFFVLIVLLLNGCNNREDKRLIPSQPIANELQEKSDGEMLFKANCSNCHKPDRDYVGPALIGSLQRWGNNKKAMYDFIRNPMKTISKNAYAKTQYEKWKTNGLMTAFPMLTDKDLDAVMRYCDNYSRPVQY